MSILRFSLVMVILCAGMLALAPANAAILEVTHTPGFGQYSSVTDALSAAVAGDTIRIIDNSAPFAETILINKVVTLEGAPSLDPRPTIIGQGGYTVEGGGDSVCTLAFGGYPNGCIIRNLIFQSIDKNGDGPEPWSFIVECRFGDNTTFENCEFDPGQNVESAIGQINRSTNTFNNCTIKGNNFGVISLGGSAVFNNCLIEASATGMALYLAGTYEALNLTMNDCEIVHYAGYGIRTFNLWDVVTTININMNRCLIKATPPSGTDIVMVRPGDCPPVVPNITIDNCDFVKTIGAEGILRGIMLAGQSNVVLTDSVFYGINPGVACWDPWGVGGTITNDYNVFQDCEFQFASVDPGAHWTALDVSDPLYVDAAAGNYKLLDTSVAATYSSGNSAETWAGSQGVAAAYEITADPANPVVAGGALTLTGPASVTDYHWEKDGEVLSDDAPRVTGTNSQTLSFTSIETGDAGVYTVYFNDGTGVQSASYTLEVDSAGDLPAASGCVIALACIGLGVIAARRAARKR